MKRETSLNLPVMIGVMVGQVCHTLVSESVKGTDWASIAIRCLIGVGVFLTFWFVLELILLSAAWFSKKVRFLRVDITERISQYKERDVYE